MAHFQERERESLKCDKRLNGGRERESKAFKKLRKSVVVVLVVVVGSGTTETETE